MMCFCLIDLNVKVIVKRFYKDISTKNYESMLKCGLFCYSNDSFILRHTF